MLILICSSKKKKHYASFSTPNKLTCLWPKENKQFGSFGCCHDKRDEVSSHFDGKSCPWFVLLANNGSILTFYSGDIVFQMKISFRQPCCTILFSRWQFKTRISYLKYFCAQFTCFLNIIFCVGSCTFP